MQFDESKDQQSIMPTSGQDDSFKFSPNGLKPDMSIESNDNDLFRFTNVVR